MNIKKILVDEVPANCWNCHLWHHETYGGVNVSQDELDICKPMERTIDDKSFKPSWCPLEVEEVCEWKKYDYVYYENPHNSNPKNRSRWCQPDEFVYCPSCGKRIKYVEVE